jgi:glycosyltransferase involved in cell wall biosynthesis
MPRVSVVIPAYNRAAFIEAAVETVLAQTFTDYEVIIVDDGSQDDTATVCAHLCSRDGRVRYFYQENRGLSAARNFGIREARGEFLAFLDSDDLWEQTKLAKQVAIMETDANVGVVYCDWADFDQSGRRTPGVHPPELGFPTIYENLLYNNVIHGSASAVLIRTECFERVGLFDESLQCLEDWDMWLRIATKYRFAKVPEVLVYLLQHSQQMQRNSQRMADALLALVEKISMSILPQFKHHVARMRWHNQLCAAEAYCGTAPRKCWRTLALAVRSWPLGVLSPRTWYVLLLSCTGPLYPQANALGLALRRWCRHHLAMDTVTGWRGRSAH